MSQCSLRAAQRAGSSWRPQCRGSSSSVSMRGTAVRVLASSAPPEAGSKGRVFVTGGNTGIGLETARSLCRQGYAVTIACRDQAKMDAAAANIRQSVPGAAIDGQLLDLASLASVRDCAARVLDSGVSYDVWLNNAGVMACPKMATQDGFEYQLGVNHLGHFLLTTEVLPALQASGKPVRLITVASAAHQFGRIDFSDLMRDAPGAYQPWDAYGQSKLANILFTYELVRRLGADTNVVANCLHPGVVRTELGRYMVDSSNSWYMAPAIALAQLLFKTPEQGAQTSIYLASDPAAGAVTGKYFTDCKPATSSPASYDTAVAAKLWEVSQELVHSSKAKAAAKAAPASVAA